MFLRGEVSAYERGFMSGQFGAELVLLHLSGSDI